MSVRTLQRKALEIDDVFDAADEQERLTVILSDVYTRMLRAVHEAVGAALADEIESFRLDDAATRRILREAASRVVRIDETTRNAIQERLAEGQRLGLSPWQIANGDAASGFRGIEQLFSETWANRGLTVARNELQQSQLVSTVDRLRATGIIRTVIAHDGGLSDSDDFCNSRNGQVFSIDNPPTLAHVNCTLSLRGVVSQEALA